MKYSFIATFIIILLTFLSKKVSNSLFAPISIEIIGAIVVLLLTAKARIDFGLWFYYFLVSYIAWAGVDLLMIIFPDPDMSNTFLTQVIILIWVCGSIASFQSFLMIFIQYILRGQNQ